MANGNFVSNLARLIGQTVTVFTTSGGESGRGFTGVLAMVNPSFIRLITQIGPAPGCALGNCCEEERERPEIVGPVEEDVCADVMGNFSNNIQGQRFNPEREENERRRRINCNANRGLGSVVDIPVDKIASFVHNAVGGGW